MHPSAQKVADAARELGLVTSHRVIEQHDGEINVLSERGRGTIFVIRLPIQPEKKDAAVSQKPEMVQ